MQPENSQMPENKFLTDKQQDMLFKLLQLAMLFVISLFEVRTSNKQDDIVAKLEGNQVANEQIAHAVKDQTSQLAGAGFGGLPSANRKAIAPAPQPSPAKGH